MNKNSSLFAYLLIFIAGSLWGTGGFFITQMTNLGASSYMTGFTAHLFALLPLLLVILFTQGVEGLKISKRGLIFAILMGILTKGFFKMSYDTTVSQLGVSTGAVLLYTSPVFVAIMSTIFYKEKLRVNNYIALALNLIGVFLMVTLGNFSSLNIAPLGILIGLLAAFLHASNTIMAKGATTEDNPITTTFYMLIFSTITQTFAAQPWTAANMDLFTNPEFLTWAILNAVITGAICNLFYIKALSAPIDASKAPVISSVEVIVATLMGVIVFKESMNIIGVIGIVMMLVSIVLMNMSTEPEEAFLADAVETSL